MANFTAVFSPSLSINQRVTSTELNQLDADHVNSLNRTGGDITGQVNLTSTGVINVENTGHILYQAGAVIEDFGSTWSFQGDMEVNGSGYINFNTGTALYSEAGSFMKFYGEVDFEGTSVATVANYFTMLTGSILTINSGGVLQSLSGAQFNIFNTTESQFQVNNFPVFNGTKSKNVVSGIANGYPFGGQTARWAQGSNGITSVTDVDSNRADDNYWIVPLPVHNGATLSQVSITYQISGAPHGVPTTKSINFVVNRTTFLTGGQVNLMSASPFTIPGTAYASSSLQVANIPCNQNNVIDTSLYSYCLIINDDSGTNSTVNNIFYQVLCEYTNISSTQWGN